MKTVHKTYLKVLRDLRNHMQSNMRHHTGRFPNFIGVASAFHLKVSDFHSMIDDDEALENASKFLEISKNSLIFLAMNADGKKPKISPSCEEIEVAIEQILSGKSWNFDDINKELSSAKI